MALTSDTPDDKKQRRRVQSKLNQRARRRRIQDTTASAQGPTKNKRPYQIERWRIEIQEPPIPPDLALTWANPEHSTKSEIPNHGTKNTSPLTPTLPADHTLLTLIHINVSRGLGQNKECLWNATSHYVPGYAATHGPITVHPDVLFYGSSLIAPSAHARLPDSLAPTEAQMSCIHATWINVLPFPRMRENLIRRERSFDHAEFVADVIGDLVDTTRIFRLPTADTATTTDLVLEYAVAVHGDDDEVTSDRNGLIVWGEPHRAESWEATPGFLRKWMWTVKGCEELLESSNRWRWVRGKEPMRLSIRQVTG